MRNILILPDGTELSSGLAGEHGIFSLTLTQCVNDSEELTIGSVCANSIEATVFNARGSLSLSAGTEVTLLREEDGKRSQVGVFTLEKPARVSQNKLRVTGYDRIRRLDRDLTQWFSALDGWPYTANVLAQMVCAECGLTFLSGDWTNGDYVVPKFSAGSITGRKLMQWLGQIFGSFCYATEQGTITYGWYRQTDITITPSGERFYFGGSLRYDDFTVRPIDRVQIQLTEDDVGVYYPQDAQGNNTYKVTGNYLLTATSPDTLLPVAQALYTRLAAVAYTPASVSVPASRGIRAGDIVAIEDSNGNTVTVYVMRNTVAGQKAKLQCTGSRDRSKTVAASDPGYLALNAKAAEIRADMEGIRTQVSHVREQAEGAAASLSEQISSILQQADRLESTVSQISSDYVTQETLSSSIRQQAQSLELRFSQVRQSIEDLDQETQRQMAQFTAFFRFQADGLYMGEEGSSLVLHQKGGEDGVIEFLRSGEPVLTIAPGGILVDTIRANKSIRIGSYLFAATEDLLTIT